MSETQPFIAKTPGGSLQGEDKFSDNGEARDTRPNSDEDAIDNATKPLLLTTPSNTASLNVPAKGRRARSESIDTLSLLSADDFAEITLHVSAASAAADDQSPTEPSTTTTGARAKLEAFWKRNQSVLLVVTSQAFNTLMNTTTRLLESEENGGLHPFQILFARMSITSFLSILYMYFESTPDFPLGAKGIRLILVLRGVSGFFGVFGLYASLQYLDLADATVLTFMAPIMSNWICAKLLHETFTRTEQVGAMFSIAGVVLIARPTILFSSNSGQAVEPQANVNATTIVMRALNATDPARPSQRLTGVGLACIGICGATMAYTTIRWIGKRAHPLVSVNYFAVVTTIISALALIFVPSVPFILPSTAKQWGLLFLIGLGGFVMQYLLTAGIGFGKGSRAMNMVYTQMLFALAADKLIWNHTPDAWSLTGSGIILGCAVVVAVQKADKGKEVESGARDEEAGLAEAGADVQMEDIELSQLGRKSSDTSESGALEPLPSRQSEA